MKRLLVFLVCTGITCCILAALFGVGDTGTYLINAGAVLIITTGAVAFYATIRDPLKGHKK